MKNPLNIIGKPLKYHHAAWWRRNYIKRVHKLADKCAEFSGAPHYVIKFGEGAMIINSKWRKAYNKRAPRDGRVNSLKLYNDYLYKTK